MLENPWIEDATMEWSDHAITLRASAEVVPWTIQGEGRVLTCKWVFGFQAPEANVIVSVFQDWILFRLPQISSTLNNVE